VVVAADVEPSGSILQQDAGVTGVSEIFTGNSVPQYPRSVWKEGKISVLGMSMRSGAVR